jgi:hypothetical protein
MSVGVVAKRFARPLLCLNPASCVSHLQFLSCAEEYGFRRVPDCAKAIPDANLLLKRQTWNTNRAIVVVSLAQIPTDLGSYLKRLRKQVAFKCGFFPIFWGVGIQVIIIAPGASDNSVDPARHVSRIDNQWAVIQSLFLVDPATQTYRAASTWGQFVTGKFQDAISATLSRHFQLSADTRNA